MTTQTKRVSRPQPLASVAKKCWHKIRLKYQTHTHKIKIRHLILASAIISGGILIANSRPLELAHAEGCPDLKIIFVRGSGGERYNTDHYIAFKTAMESKLNTSTLNYEIDDLDYPAIGVGVENLDVTIGAYVGRGDAYAFGDSVKAGVNSLVSTVNTSSCKNTKYVFAGYSQGALVIPTALSKINSDRVIYSALFGDPKIYLPEGAGRFPAACSGKNLSAYRVYVPDCRAYVGLLGARNPYVSSGYAGKIGTWCNKYDIFCSSHFSISSHTAYATDGIYEDASKLIFNKITEAFNLKNEYISLHDTAILIDSTGSMSWLFSKYRNEALRLAEKTLNAGGRVALYDYRDIADGYAPVERCSFETCTLETFTAGLDAITIEGGGDDPESLLSASFQVMKKLNWRFGATKSLVVLTDAGFHSPDLDGTTFYDVKKLSQQIDPVNFYILTPEYNFETYQPLAEATGGAVVSATDEIELEASTDAIIERFDSLPQVEEEYADETYDNTLPSLSITSVEIVSDTASKVSFKTDGTKTLVILNDAILGVTTDTEITLADLDRSIVNTLTLVPLSDSRRGESASVDLSTEFSAETTPDASDDSATDWTPAFAVPLAPNTGRR